MVRKLLSGSLIAALLAGTASADTLRDALVSAYQANPTLTAQREALKATDATVAIARAAGRPQVSGTVGLNRDLTRSGILDTGGKGPTRLGGVDLSYPLFNGGAVKNSVKAAKTRVEAGRATLRAVEGDVFTQAVAAYMDVIRDRAIVELNANNVQGPRDQSRSDPGPLPDRRPDPHRRRPVRSAASARPLAACRLRRAGRRRARRPIAR